MSKTNELLNSLSNDDIALYTANPDTEPHIIVGEDRIVVVPEELQRIAVQRDHLIETVTFDCPRYWDGYDMSKMVIYINYLPPDITEAGSYICTNVRVSETNPNIMHFDWTITENVTINEGRLIFLVDVKGANGEHWHSELNEDMYISEGIEPPPFIDIPNPDILTQVLLFNANILELSDITLKRAAVYVGSGEMPEGYNVQIDPEGESEFEATVRQTTENIADRVITEYLQDYAPGVYVGSGEMPEGYVVQIDPDGDVEDDETTTGTAEVTAESIEVALGYTPADEKDIPKVYSWANAELPFTENEISGTISGAGFVTNPDNFADGKTYFRYHAGASYGFVWTNPNPQKGSLTITARAYAQWGTSLDTKLVVQYTDGTDNSLTDMFKLTHGATVTYISDASKTVASIRGNYDFENWVLLDMDVMSIVADYSAPATTTESWTFTLEDGSTVTKEVYVK